MKEIKFRVWTEVSHEWIGMKYLELKDVSTNYNDTLMQYTGLKDKNGKEIYEGDIVKTEYPPVGRYVSAKIFIGTIITTTTEFGVETIASVKEGGKLKFSNKIEVIGNIYENPSLIK